MKSALVSLVRVLVLLLAIGTIAQLYYNSEAYFKKTLFSMPRPQKYVLDVGRVYFGNEINAMTTDSYTIEILNPNTNEYVDKENKILNANNKYEIEDIIHDESDNRVTLKIRNTKGD